MMDFNAALENLGGFIFIYFENITNRGERMSKLILLRHGQSKHGNLENDLLVGRDALSRPWEKKRRKEAGTKIG